MRKTLGEHEIATVQTTAIWQGAGIPGPYSRIRRGNGSHRIGRVPSCRDSDAASHGRALTYAPLCAVTFGGIAGENGLDAPDIAASTARDGLRQWPWPRPRCPSGKPAQGVTKTPSPHWGLAFRPHCEISAGEPNHRDWLGSGCDALGSLPYVRQKRLDGGRPPSRRGVPTKLASFPGPLEGLSSAGLGFAPKPTR